MNMSLLSTVLFLLPFVPGALGAERWAAENPGRAPTRQTQEPAGSNAAPEGLTAADWSSIRRQYQQYRHRVVEVAGGQHARNPGQQWLTRFDGRGFMTHPDAGAWRWGLELRSYGFAGHERAPAVPPQVSTAGSRVTYRWDALLQEWFVNDPRGLEHGFTLLKRPWPDEPARSQGNEAQHSSLNFFLSVRGGLRPEVEADGRGVRFVDARGRVALTYAGLSVRDADGRDLPARFDLVPGEAGSFQPAADEARLGGDGAADCAPCHQSLLRLAIDEHTARYPLTIDPVAQQAYLKPSNGGDGDQFGYTMAISGDTVVVGTPYEDSPTTGVNGDQGNGASDAGAAYVFVRNGSTWTQQAYLKASNTEADDHFGSSVAVSGDTVVVGAPGESSAAAGVNGNQADNSASGAGAVYVFVRNGTNWTQQAYLKASNAGAGDAFGSSVAASGNTVVAGAINESSAATGVNGNQNDNNATQSGAAYVFVRSGANWSQQAYLKASNTRAGDSFGWSAAVSGDTAVVATPYEASAATGINGNQTNNSALWAGAAYVFVRNGTTWTQQAYLKASNAEKEDRFGWSVAAWGDTVVVGAPYEGSAATGINGNQANNNAFESGAVYVFVRNGTTWSQQAYVKASNAQFQDWFGYSVALEGDRMVVGAVNEDSGATGVNGNQSDNSVGDSGAAYLFVRSGTTWTQDAYLKASNTDQGNDYFGWSVGVSGNTVVVSADFERSPASGINVNQFDSDTSPGAHGAVYVFNLTASAPGKIAVQQPADHNLVNGTSAVAFGGGLVGSARSQTFTIYNFGELDLTGISLSITGPQAQDFVVTNSPKAKLSGCASTIFTVRFSPRGTGPRTAVLHVLSSDATHSPFDVILTGTGLSPEQLVYVKASNPDWNDLFGYSVAMSGDTLVVGAPYEESAARGVNGSQTNDTLGYAGAAYVFVRNGTSWTQQAYLKASNTGTRDQFGWSVAISGETVVIGAPEEGSTATGINGDQSNDGAYMAGAAYVFVRNGTTWTQQAYLKASNTESGDRFGYSVAISGGTILVGAIGESSAATGVNSNQGDNSAPQAGAAYVFVRNGTTWTQQAYLKASNADRWDSFGLAVALSGDTAVVGTFYECSAATGVNGNQADNSADQAGAAYVFVRNGTTWSQQAYLKASNTDAADNFGWSVAVSGDTVVVGATGEASAATGVNGNQNDDTMFSAGAAYVFVRSGANWTQQAYLKAPRTSGSSSFGSAVAVSGDSVVVGAPGEASAATGIDGDQEPPLNTSTIQAGAAYVFIRKGTSWTQQAYLKASNTDGHDEFGNAVAISGETVVVGANGESGGAAGINGAQDDNSTMGAGAVYLYTGMCPGVRLTVTPDTTGGYFLRWRGAAGLTYHLERASSISGEWTPLASRTAPPFGDMVYQDDFPLAGQAFYRVAEGD